MIGEIFDIMKVRQQITSGNVTEYMRLNKNIISANTHKKKDSMRNVLILKNSEYTCCRHAQKYKRKRVRKRAL